MSKLRIGLIGGGAIAHAHLPHLAQNPEVELVGVADPNPAAQAAADQYGIPKLVGDYRDLLPLVDAVLICVPTFLHAEIAVMALNAGKAVFCEKPLARTLEQSSAIEAAIQASGAPFQVGFVRRFDSEWLAFREVVQKEKIGRPVIWHIVGSGVGPEAPWFHNDALGGGPFLDACIHSLDFALYTFGPAKWAFCNGRTFRKGADAIDTGTATVRFESEDELMLAWSWGIPPKAPSAGVCEFIGPGGTITWPAIEEAQSKEGILLVHQGETEERIPFPVDALTQAFAAQMDEFVQVAQGKAVPRVGIAEGRESLKLALAIIESARTSQVVKL